MSDQLSLFTISQEEMMSEKWALARQMCEWYGYDIHEIAARIAHFRILRTEFAAAAMTERASKLLAAPPRPAAAPSQVVNFKDVRHHWNDSEQRWDSDRYVYIGRGLRGTNLPKSIWANPFRIWHDTDEMRWKSVQQYRVWLSENDQLLTGLIELRGKILVCHCRPRKRCHGDVLVELLKESAHATP